MSKIFNGSDVYQVSNANEAFEVMYEIARRALGTFDGYPCRETGFYVDPADAVNIGGDRKLYRVKGTLDGKPYAETDDPNLLSR